MAHSKGQTASMALPSMARPYGSQPVPLSGPSIRIPATSAGRYRCPPTRARPSTGATVEVLKAIFSDRFVTGVTWLGGELWHATWEEEESTLRHIDPSNGAVLEERVMPDGKVISGLESDGKDRFFCGGGTSGVLRALRR